MARITLLEMLLRAGLINEKQCDDALQNRVFYGGKIGTSLIELGLISEVELASFLSRKLAVPYIAPEQLRDIPAGTIALIPKTLALKYHVIPLKLELKKLTLAMADPADLKAIDEISFATGFIVRPVITPEVRLTEALAAYYDAEVDPRYLQIAKKLEAERGLEAKHHRTAAVANGEPVLPPSTIKSSRTGSTRMAVADKGVTGVGSPKKTPAAAGLPSLEIPGRKTIQENAAADLSPLEPCLADPPAKETPVKETPAKETPVKETPVKETPVKETPVKEAPLKKVPLEETTDMDEKEKSKPVQQPPATSVTKGAAAETGLLEAEVVDEEWLGRVEKYSVSTLSQKLSRVEDREEIGNVLIEYMRSRFERSALFILRGGAAYGWKGTAAGRELPSFGQFRLPLDSPSILKSVAEGEEMHIGPIPETVSNGLLQEALGSVQGDALALPLNATGTTVGIVYVENTGGNIEAELPELKKVINKAGLAFEILLSREKILVS